MLLLVKTIFTITHLIENYYIAILVIDQQGQSLLCLLTISILFIV